MAKGNSSGSSRTTALITAIGVVFGAAITNVDGLGRLVKGVQAVTAEYSGYAPTGVFETEFRYYYEVSGARADVEDFEDRVVEATRQELIQGDPQLEEEINALFEIMTEEAPQFDEVMELILPIYEAHYTVQEIQKLNRFYSTTPLQDMVRKDRLINAELAPVFVQLQQDYIERITPAIVDLLFGS